MRLLWEQVYRLGYVSLGLPHHLFTTSSEPYSVCCSLMTDHSRIMPRKFSRPPPNLTSVHDAGLKKYTTIYPWLLHTHIKTIWCLMYLLVPTCQTSTCQVKILCCVGIRMVKWWVLSNFVSLLTLPDQVARPDWKWKSFPIMSGHVPWSLQQIASPLIILYNPIYATTQCARILQRKFVF